MMCGGYSDAKPASDKVKEITAAKKAEIETQLGKTFDTFEAISYTTQVVAGTNADIKVHIGDNKYIHISVFIALECNGGAIELTNVAEGKTLEDAL